MADYQRGEEFDELLSMIPAAFFKSIGYTAVACLLGGALTGFTEPASEDTAKWKGARHGGMVLAIDIESIVPTDIFHAEVDRLVRDVRETYEPMPGTDKALLPGAIEQERVEHHRRVGIRYGEMEQESARSASERLSVPLPWDE